MYTKRKSTFGKTVIRPKQNTMILEAMLENYNNGNNIKVGDAITVLPFLTESKVSNIHFFDQQFDEASVGSSIKQSN
jgi:sulfate adenylyltransferase subunit 1